MSPQKTATNTTLISGSESASGSVPNLSTYSETDFQTNICLRKRKERPEEIDYKNDFEKFRTDMMKLLSEFGKTQNENLICIRHEISEIKNEIKTINSTTENITKNIEHINNEMKNMKSDQATTEIKIRQIETEICQLKDQQNIVCSTSKSPNLHHHNLFLELQDRCDRAKNIVIVGILEINDKNSNSRRNHDNNEVKRVLKSIYEECPNPIKSIRLGKYIPNKNRPIKIFFDCPSIPKYLLRNRKKLPEDIQIYSDQTPAQKEYLRLLKEELIKRIEKGEKDLIIKYVKGIPTIVTNNHEKNQ